MINSINFIDGLDGLSSGIGDHRGADARHDQPLTLASASRSIAVLCFALAGALLGFLRWNFHPASIFIGTSGVMFVGYTLALLSILGTAKVAVALLVLGVPIIDTFWIIVRRLSQRSVAVHPGPRPHPPPAARPRALAPADRAAHLWRCAGLAVLAFVLSGASLLYAFLVVFIAAGLVLFLPIRGDFGRPDELEAETYEPDHDDGTPPPP